MPQSNFVRTGGGLASAAAGLLLFPGHLFDLGGEPEYGTGLGGTGLGGTMVLAATRVS